MSPGVTTAPPRSPPGSGGAPEPTYGRGHRGVVHPDDDDVVRVVRHRRRKRTALQPEAADEAQAGAPGAEMPFDDGDLREVAPCVGNCLTCTVGGLVLERVRHD